MVKINVKIIWDYPSMPIDLFKIKDLQEKETCLKVFNIVAWRYVKMNLKTLERIEKMLVVVDAFKEYLDKKKSFDIFEKIIKRKEIKL